MLSRPRKGAFDIYTLCIKCNNIMIFYEYANYLGHMYQRHLVVGGLKSSNCHVDKNKFYRINI